MSQSTMTSEEREQWLKQIPRQCSFWLEAMARDVVQYQPKYIDDFACIFFNNQAKLREVELQNLPVRSYYDQLVDKMNVNKPVPLSRRPVYIGIPDEAKKITKKEAMLPVPDTKGLSLRRFTAFVPDKSSQSVSPWLPRRYTTQLSAPQLKSLFPHTSDPGLTDSTFTMYQLDVETNTPWKIEVIGVEDAFLFDTFNYESLLNDINANALVQHSSIENLTTKEILNMTENKNALVGFCMQNTSQSLPTSDYLSKLVYKVHGTSPIKENMKNPNSVDAFVDDTINLIKQWIGVTSDICAVKYRCCALNDFIQNQKSLKVRPGAGDSCFGSPKYQNYIPNTAVVLPDIQYEVKYREQTADNTLDENDMTFSELYLTGRENKMADTYKANRDVFAVQFSHFTGDKFGENVVESPSEMRLNMWDDVNYEGGKSDGSKQPMRSRLDSHDYSVPKLETIVEEIEQRNNKIAHHAKFQESPQMFVEAKQTTERAEQFIPCKNPVNLQKKEYGDGLKQPVYKGNGPAGVDREINAHQNKSTKKSDAGKVTSDCAMYSLPWGSCWSKANLEVVENIQSSVEKKTVSSEEFGEDYQVDEENSQSKNAEISMNYTGGMDYLTVPIVTNTGDNIQNMNEHGSTQKLTGDIDQHACYLNKYTVDCNKDDMDMVYEDIGDCFHENQERILSSINGTYIIDELKAGDGSEDILEEFPFSFSVDSSNDVVSLKSFDDDSHCIADEELLKEFAEISDVLVDNIVKNSVDYYSDYLSGNVESYQYEIGEPMEYPENFTGPYNCFLAGVDSEESSNSNGTFLNIGEDTKEGLNTILNQGFVEDTFDLDSECDMNHNYNIAQQEGKQIKNNLSVLVGDLINEIFDRVYVHISQNLVTGDVDEFRNSEDGKELLEADSVIQAVYAGSKLHADNNYPNVSSDYSEEDVSEKTNADDGVKCKVYTITEFGCLQNADSFNVSKPKEVMASNSNISLATTIVEDKNHSDFCTEIVPSDSDTTNLEIDDIGETILNDCELNDNYREKELCFTPVENYWCAGIHIIVQFVD